MSAVVFAKPIHRAVRVVDNWVVIAKDKSHLAYRGKSWNVQIAFIEPINLVPDSIVNGSSNRQL